MIGQPRWAFAAAVGYDGGRDSAKEGRPSSATTLPGLDEIVYPSSDGKPMAENTLQFRWIVAVKENLDHLFRDDPNVFVAGDNLWYPVRGHNRIRQAPDVYVAFGRPKGDRGSYMQWVEGDIPPQVVFEILSPGNRPKEMKRKFAFYEKYGVEEYYVYDPDRDTLTAHVRRGGRLTRVERPDGWVSPRLGVRFDLSAAPMRIFGPDGGRFRTVAEIAAAEEDERRRADDQQRRADDQQRRAESAEAKLARLAEKLRAAGLDPNGDSA